MSASDPFDRLRREADRIEEQQQQDDDRDREQRERDPDVFVEGLESAPEPEDDIEPGGGPPGASRAVEQTPEAAPQPEPEPDPTPPDEDATATGPTGDGLLETSADVRDREIIENIAREQEEVERADRQLREAADRQDIENVTAGADGLLRSELRQEQRRRDRITERESQFDALLRTSQDIADREAFEEDRRDIIQDRLDTADELRDVGTGRDDTAEDQEDTEFAPEAADVEQGLQRAAGEISQTFDELVGQDVVLPTDPTAVALGVQEGPTRDITEFERGAVRSTFALGNVPATALGLGRSAEFAGERAGEVATGQADVAVEETDAAVTERVEAVETEIRERPERFAGSVIGSLAFSGGAFGVARAVGPRAGAATRLAVQPGEELVGEVGGRGTRALAGDRAADVLFPQNEPLVFSEEAALRGAERVATGIGDVASRTRVRGVGMGFPALEVEAETELEQEQEQPGELTEEDLTTPTLLIESERLQTEIEQGLLFGDVELETELEQETETELEQETETELKDEVETELRTDVRPELGTEQDLFTEPDVAVDQELNLEQETEQETETEPPTETELVRELEAEVELEAEAEAEREQELELELETEQESELERLPFELGAPLGDEPEPAEVGFEGVRAVEARLVERELDVE